MGSFLDIIEGIDLEAKTVGSSFFGKPRWLIRKHGVRAMDKVGLTFGLKVRGMNVNIPSVCKVYKPDDYHRFVRAYLLMCDGRKIELDRNNDIPSDILNYLLDCDGTLMRDCDTTAMTSNCIRCNPTGEGCEDANCSSCGGTGKCCQEDWEQFLQDLEDYKESWIKEHQDYFEFSSNLEDVFVVIEYVANQTVGIEECAIKIPKNMEEIIEYFIKFKLLEGSSLTLQESQYYYQKYKNVKEREKIIHNQLTMNDLMTTAFMRQ